MANRLLEKLRDSHILVAGEIGIDQYIWGDSYRISPEAPVPVIEVQSESEGLGLAANVAQNIAALGAKTTLVSVRGKDEAGEKILGLLKKAGISQSELVEDVTRPTLRKVRIVARKQHVVRVDYERVHPLDTKIAKQFTDRICDLLPSCDGLILQDYAKGLWNEDTVRVIQVAKEKKKPVFVDPSRLANAKLYRGATLLSPNIAEAQILSGIGNHKPTTDKTIIGTLAKKILDITESEHAVITCGSDGMLVASKNGSSVRHIPTFARDVFDVTGAGDTVIALLALGYTLPLPIERCMELANAAAGLVVAKVGTATVAPAALQIELQRLQKEGLLTDFENWGIV